MTNCTIGVRRGLTVDRDLADSLKALGVDPVRLEPIENRTLRALENWWRKEGAAPSSRQLAAEAGVSSSAVLRDLCALVADRRVIRAEVNRQLLWVPRAMGRHIATCGPDTGGRGRTGPDTGGRKQTEEGLAEMTFDQAANFKMTFGKFRGRTLAEVAREPRGLRYLDWLVGRDFARNGLPAALAAFLAEPRIAKRLRELMERNGQ